MAYTGWNGIEINTELVACQSEILPSVFYKFKFKYLIQTNRIGTMCGV